MSINHDIQPAFPHHWKALPWIMLEFEFSTVLSAFCLGPKFPSQIRIALCSTVSRKTAYHVRNHHYQYHPWHLCLNINAPRISPVTFIFWSHQESHPYEIHICSHHHQSHSWHSCFNIKAPRLSSESLMFQISTTSFNRCIHALNQHDDSPLWQLCLKFSSLVSSVTCLKFRLRVLLRTSLA